MEFKELNTCLMNKEGTLLSMKLPSRMDAIKPALEKVEFFVRKTSGDYVDISRLKVVLRELLANAITHGSKDLQEASVALKVKHIKNCTYEVSVKDKGKGFNFKTVDFSLPKTDVKRQIHRGLRLVKALSEKIIFNGHGNHVLAIVSVAQGDFILK
jgi:anti-sigma regulatory factor (Ser/Thr protein kinase)